MSAPTELLAHADQWLALSVRAFEIAMSYRARAGAAGDAAYAEAARALGEERASCRIELAVLRRLDVERFRAGDLTP